MLLASPHCRNSLQRLRKEALAPSFPGSLRTSRRALRPVLSSEDGNFSGKWTGLPVVVSILFRQDSGHQKHVEQHDGPRMRDGVAEASRQWTPCDLKLCKLGALAKIAVSQGFHHPVLMDVSKVTPPTAVSLWSYGFRPRGPKNGAETCQISRASAHSFTQACNGQEARQGYFPPSSLQHQTGPP